MERISYSSTIEAPIEEVWEFHMNPQNLCRITPQGSAVRVLTENPVIRKDALIKVEVRVLHFLPVVMENRILVVERPTCFVDVQEHGPFLHFRHEHRFEDLGGGRTLLNDAVEFESRGLLGRMADAPILRYEFEHLLKVRHKKTREILEREHAAHDHRGDAAAASD